MDVSIATSVWVTVVITLFVWLFVRFGMMLPAQRELFSSPPEKLANEASVLAGLQLFEAFLRAALIALAVLTVLAFGLDLYADSLPSNEEGLISLVAARDTVDTVFGWTRTLSWWSWLIALTFLMIVFFVVTISKSGSRWKDAVEARQSAIDTALGGLDDADVERMAKEEVPEAEQGLLESVAALRERNKAAHEDALHRPVITLQDEAGAMVSYHQFVDFIEQLRAEAREFTDAGDSRTARERRELADIYEGQREPVAKQVTYQAESLMHSETLSLSDGDGDVFDWQAELTAMRRTALRENRLSLHTEMTDIQRRSEPELWHEYVSTAVTSEAATKTAGWFGRNTRMIALATFFVGFFSFGASAEIGDFSESAADREVQMTLAIGDQELDAALVAGSTEPTNDSEDATLASDAATEARLRRAMRTNLARTLMRGVVTGAENVALSSVQDAGLRGLGTRENLVQNAARDGASSIDDPSRRRTRIAADLPQASGSANSVDEIFDRRIAQLREKPRVWRKLRASASTPARGGLISNQLLSATLGDNDFTRSQAFVKAADRSTAQFAKSVAETGEIPRNLDELIPGTHNPALFSNQQQRQFAQYQQEAGRRVNSRLGQVRSGRANVGSLFRAVPDIDGSGLKRKVAGSYSDTFPANNRGSRFGFAEGISNKSSNISRRSGASGAGGRSGGRGPRIRRKGVILAANPINLDASVPLDEFSYSIDGDTVNFVLRPEGSDQLVRLGGFDRETVNTALAFAADGRPDLASMPEMFFVQGDPVLDGMNDFTRRIVLHPAIQDTDLACNAIWLDRLIDLSMRIDANIAGQSKLLDGWLANRELGFSEGRIELDSSLARHVNSCGTGGNCFPVNSYLGQGLDLGYYTAPLTCLASGESDCGTYAGEAAHAYNMTSIVEEIPYELTPDFGFLTGGDSPGALWPFSFKMRAVPLARIEGQQVSLPGDFTAWDFPGAQEEIDRVVTENLAFEPGARNIHKRMRDFTVLQRMFKTALDGRFGVAFPYDRLLELQEVTRDAVTISRTGNWDIYNIYDGRQDYFARHMNSMAAQLMPTLELLAEEGGQACVASARGALAAQRRRPLPRGAGLWAEIGAVTVNCRSELSNPSIQVRSLSGRSSDQEIAALTGGRTPVSSISFRDIVSRAREQDLIADAMMMARGEYNIPAFSCPSR